MNLESPTLYETLDRFGRVWYYFDGCMNIEEVTRVDELARIFKALSDPNRLAILQLIRARCRSGCRLSEESQGHSVSEIAEQFDLALSTVSHHLKELKNAGLIKCEKQGQCVYCAPNDEALKKIEEFVGS